MQLLISACIIFIIVDWGILAPASLGAIFDRLFAATTINFGGLYLWVVLGVVMLSVLLAFSRYGNLKLGGAGFTFWRATNEGSEVQ